MLMSWDSHNTRAMSKHFLDTPLKNYGPSKQVKEKSTIKHGG
jgi:hypothetical protein